MTLSSQAQQALRRVAGMMIPASARFDLPGADDETIFADIVVSLGRDTDDVAAALRALDQYAAGPFAEADTDTANRAAARLRAEDSALAAALSRVVVQCYYRDERVMRSLGVEVRPPFPQGHTVQQGDWSLLEPVRARPKFYREAPR